ncbi:MAG: response regulator transcription factor, partial [Ottowia sp.]
IAGDAAAARALLEKEPFHMAMLDIAMPGEDGLSLGRWLRSKFGIGIIYATAAGAALDRIVGLELGADDYMPKPFEPRELVARVQNVLRRRESAPDPLAADPALRFDGLLVNPATRSVQRQGAGVELTSTEFDLLHLLARSPGKVFSRDDILAALRGHEVELHTRAVDILVSRLRKKLEPLDAVKTLRNAGYTLALQRQR